MANHSGEAHDAILAVCRKDGCGWAMRELNGAYYVIDFKRNEPVPGGYSWEKRERRVAEGDSWEAVAEQIFGCERCGGKGEFTTFTDCGIEICEACGGKG